MSVPSQIVGQFSCSHMIEAWNACPFFWEDGTVVLSWFLDVGEQF